MPDNRLEGLGVRSGMRGIDGWDDYASICDLRGEAAVSPNDADHPGALLFSELQRKYQVRTYLLFQVAAPDREYEDCIFRTKSAYIQPSLENARPSFVVRTSCQFGDV